MQKIIAEIKVVPLGTGSTSLSAYVAAVEDVLKDFPGLKSRLTPMSTILEGDIDEIFQALRAMHEVPFMKGARRVSTQISIDDRRDRDTGMDQKIQSVISKSGK